MAHGLDGCDGFSLIFFIVKSKKKNPLKSVASAQSVCHSNSVNHHTPHHIANAQLMHYAHPLSNAGKNRVIRVEV